MQTRTFRLGLVLSAVVLMGAFSGCAPRRGGAPVYGPPDIRRVTGTGVMNVAPAPAPRPAPAPAPPPQSYSLAGSVTADGFGVPNAGMPAAQGRQMARRAALTDARRNLLEQVQGVAVTSETSVQNFMTQYDVIRSQVSGYINNAQIIDEGQQADGTYYVRVAADLGYIGGVINQHAPPQPSAPAYAPPPPTPVQGGPQQAQARALAKRAATMDGHRQLLEMAKGVRIDSSTTVQDLILVNDTIRSRIEGIIRGARVVDTRYHPDGTVEVDMEFDMNQVRYNVR